MASSSSLVGEDTAYLKEHRICERLEAMIRHVLLSRPEDPVLAMCNHLNDVNRSGSGIVLNRSSFGNAPGTTTPGAAPGTATPARATSTTRGGPEAADMPTTDPSGPNPPPRGADAVGGVPYAASSSTTNVALIDGPVTAGGDAVGERHTVTTVTTTTQRPAEGGKHADERTAGGATLPEAADPQPKVSTSSPPLPPNESPPPAATTGAAPPPMSPRGAKDGVPSIAKPPSSATPHASPTLGQQQSRAGGFATTTDGSRRGSSLTTGRTGSAGLHLNHRLERDDSARSDVSAFSVNSVDMSEFLADFRAAHYSLFGTDATEAAVTIEDLAEIVDRVALPIPDTRLLHELFLEMDTADGAGAVPFAAFLARMSFRIAGRYHADVVRHVFVALARAVLGSTEPDELRALEQRLEGLEDLAELQQQQQHPAGAHEAHAVHHHHHAHAHHHHHQHAPQQQQPQGGLREPSEAAREAAHRASAAAAAPAPSSGTPSALPSPTTAPTAKAAERGSPPFAAGVPDASVTLTLRVQTRQLVDATLRGVGLRIGATEAEDVLARVGVLVTTPAAKDPAAVTPLHIVDLARFLNSATAALAPGARSATCSVQQVPSVGADLNELSVSERE